MRLGRSLRCASFLLLVAFAYFVKSAPGDCPPEQVCSTKRRPPPDIQAAGKCGPDQVCSNQGSTQTDNSGTDETGETDNNRPGGFAERRIKENPNIIFILLDDVGNHDVGWNNPKMHTPFMNQLAKEGVILRNHYSLPTCTPSRASFLSGRHASKLGLQRGELQLLEPYGIPTKFTLLPQALKDLDYKTHALGKWHVGYCSEKYTPMGRGFDTFYGFYNGAENNYEHCNEDNIYFQKPNCSYYDFRDGWEKGSSFKGQFSGHLYGNRAVEIIREHKTSRPLFMYLALSHTHFPLQAPAEYCRNCGAYDDNEPRRKMCCAMAAADSVVKNVTMALKKKRMYDNSIIVVVSDNGGSVHFGASNLPYKGNKGSLWEGGSHTPAFVHSPLLKKKGYKNKSLIHITDWYTTFVKLAGGEPALDLDGYDQWRTISQNKPTRRNSFLYNLDEQSGTWYGAVRVGDWKLVVAPPESQVPNEVVPESQTEDHSFDVEYLSSYTHPKIFTPDSTRYFLYDLSKDIGETTNLAYELAHKGQLKILLEFELQYHMNTIKPAVKINNDPAGSPTKDGGWYWVGWCRHYYDVPVRRNYSDLLIDYPR